MFAFFFDVPILFRLISLVTGEIATMWAGPFVFSLRITPVIATEV